MLYCLNYEGTMYLLEPDPKACTVVSRFELPPGDSTTHIAYPVICGGRLYLRHWNELFVYDVKR